MVWEWGSCSTPNISKGILDTTHITGAYQWCNDGGLSISLDLECDDVCYHQKLIVWKQQNHTLSHFERAHQLINLKCPSFWEISQSTQSNVSGLQCHGFGMDQFSDATLYWVQNARIYWAMMSNLGRTHNDHRSGASGTALWTMRTSSWG